MVDGRADGRVYGQSFEVKPVANAMIQEADQCRRYGMVELGTWGPVGRGGSGKRHVFEFVHSVACVGALLCGLDPFEPST